MNSSPILASAAARETMMPAEVEMISVHPRHVLLQHADEEAADDVDGRDHQARLDVT
jgi:hypothetical protein